MNKIVTKTCLCACALVISTANCFASNTPNYHKFAQPNLEQPFAYINFDQATAEYLQSMRNADTSQGTVSWGGELELNAIAQIYNICIIVKEVHQDGHVTHTTINKGKAQEIKLHYSNNHYTYYNADGDLVEVNGDGNCMFTASLKALGLDGSLAAVTKLRNKVVNHMSQDPDIKEKISNSLAGDGRINGEASLADMQKLSIPIQADPVKKQKRQYSKEGNKRCRYSQEDNERLLQKKRDNPDALTKKEREHLRNLQRAEEIKQYCQDHAEERKQQSRQYYQDNAEKIKQYRQDHVEKMKQYRQDNAEKIKQQNKQYQQDHAEEIKQWRKDNAEEIKQWHKQYQQDNAEKIKQYYQDYAKKQQKKAEQGVQQARIKYAGYRQTTSEEPKKTFKAWCEQRLKTIEYPKALQQTGAASDLIGMQRSSNLIQVDPVKKQKYQYNKEGNKRYRYSQEDNDRLLQMAKNNPGELTHKERQHVYQLKLRDKYIEYLQTTSDEPKKTFKSWGEQRLKTIEYPKALQQTGAASDQKLSTDLEQLLTKVLESTKK